MREKLRGQRETKMKLKTVSCVSDGGQDEGMYHCDMRFHKAEQYFHPW